MGGAISLGDGASPGGSASSYVEASAATDTNGNLLESSSGAAVGRPSDIPSSSSAAQLSSSSSSSSAIAAAGDLSSHIASGAGSALQRPPLHPSSARLALNVNTSLSECTS